MKHTTWIHTLRVCVVMIGGWFLFAPSAAVAQQRHPNEQFRQITGQHRADIVDSLCRAFNEVYIFADVAKDMETRVRAHLASGAYDDLNTLSEFTHRLTEDFRSVSEDLHIRVGASPMTELPKEDDPEEQKKQLQLPNLKTV